MRVSFQRSDKFLIELVEICPLLRPVRVVKLQVEEDVKDASDVLGGQGVTYLVLIWQHQLIEDGQAGIFSFIPSSKIYFCLGCFYLLQYEGANLSQNTLESHITIKCLASDVGIPIVQGSIVEDDAALALDSSLCAYLELWGSCAQDNSIGCPVLDVITRLVR